MDALKLGDSIDKRGEWTLFYGRETVKLPILITNARINHGNMEFMVQYAPGRSDVWVPASAVRVDWDDQRYEQEAPPEHPGLCSRHWDEVASYFRHNECIACEEARSRHAEE